MSGDVFGVDGSDQAYTAAIGAGSYHYALVPTIGEGAIRAKITSGVGNVRPGLICKYVDANNFIFVECSNQFGLVYVNKRVAGVTTTIYTSGFGAQGADGRTLRITRTGSSTTGGLVIEVAVNGAVLTTLTVTDAVFDGAGQAGLISLGSTLFTGIRWDDFQQYTPGSGLGAAALIPVGSKAAWRIVDSGTERGAQLFSSGVDVFNNVQVWETGSADKTVTVKLLTDAQDYDTVVVRYKDKDNCLYLQASATYGGWTLVKRIAGVSTNIADIGGSNRAGAVVKVQVIGDRIRIKTNGSWLSAGGNSGLIQIPTDAMTACGTATRHGFGPVTQRGTYTTVWGWVRFDDSFTLSHAGSKIAFGPTTLGGGGQNDLLQLLPRLQSTTSPCSAGARTTPSSAATTPRWVRPPSPPSRGASLTMSTRAPTHPSPSPAPGRRTPAPTATPAPERTAHPLPATPSRSSHPPGTTALRSPSGSSRRARPASSRSRSSGRRYLLQHPARHPRHLPGRRPPHRPYPRRPPHHHHRHLRHHRVRLLANRGRQPGRGARAQHGPVRNVDHGPRSHHLHVDHHRQDRRRVDHEPMGRPVRRHLQRAGCHPRQRPRTHTGCAHDHRQHRRHDHRLVGVRLHPGRHL